MERNPATTSHSAAPGPPTTMATATPPILPIPTVPEIAVATAWKWDISPLAAGLWKWPFTWRTASQKPRTLRKPM